MIYVGIDIAKANHYASIVDYSTGEVVENKDNIIIGLEFTAHYDNYLIFYLFKLGIINPIQTASLRKTRIRKVKNDKVDSMLICEALSLGYYNLLST